MKIIELPTKVFDGNTEEAESLRDLGLEVDDNLIDSTLTVNVNHIVAFNEDSEGDTTLYLTGDPIPFKIHLKLEQFKNRLRKAVKYGDL